MKETRLLILFNRAIEETITSQEREELFQLLLDAQNKQYVEELFDTTWEEFQPEKPVFQNEEGSKMLRGIIGQYADDQLSNRFGRTVKNWRMLAAACILLAVTTAIFFIAFPENSSELILTQAIDGTEIIPGTASATIALGDGSMIILDHTEEGVITEETGMYILKSRDGQISYASSSEGILSETSTVYHTISVPKGGYYHLTLSDGTEVHLNSESSLRYPVRFTGSLREVVLNGEAYFSVNPKQIHETSMEEKAVPFLVKTATQQVEVLGTIFNINAYRSAPVKTTLVEGSVRICSTSGKAVLLRPGETAINKEESRDFEVIKADLDAELAWRSGYFIFNNEPIESIMERVARWYDVKVEYKGNVQNKRFGGVFQKSKSLSQLLEHFRDTGLIDFKIEGRRVIMMPN